MKKSFLIRAAAATFMLAAVFFGAGCAQDSGDDDSSPAVTLTDAQKAALVKSALDVGYATGDSADWVTGNVTLPVSNSSYSDVTISWSSNASNIAISGTTGTVTQPTSNNKTVTLTATITCGTEIVTKTFALTVINKTTAETLNALAITYATGDSASSVTQNVTLPSALSSYTVTWNSNLTKYITTAGAVTRDIVDVPVTLTATVSSGTSEIGKKPFVLTVKQVPQVTYTYTESETTYTTKYTFTSDTITYTYTDSSNSSENESRTYTFTADTDTGTLTATMTGITINGTSYTKDTYTAYLTNMYSAVVTFYKTICEDNDVTYDDLISALKTSGTAMGETYDDATAAEYCYEEIYGKDKTITDYAAALKAKTTLTADSHTAFASLLTQMGYSSWDAALVDISAQAKTQAEYMFSARTYSYTLVTTTYTTYYTDGYVFNTAEKYDTTKKWWEQSNNYPRYVSSDSSVRFSPMNDDGLRYGGFQYSGTLSDDHTTFTETTSGKAWAIISDGKGTLTLTNGSTSYTVTFEGNELGSN